MAFLFREKIFSGIVPGTAEVFSDGTLDDLLGQAEILVFEFYIDSTSGTSPTLTAVVYESNTRRKWTSYADLLTTQAISSTLPDVLSGSCGMTGATAVKGAFARLGLSTPSGVTARVDVYVTGRSL